jgi:hypothetical protein
MWNWFGIASNDDLSITSSGYTTKMSHNYLANAICTNLLVLLIHPDSFSKKQIFHQSLLVHAVYPVYKVKITVLNTTYNKTPERMCIIVISYSAQKTTASYMSKTLLPPSPVG